MSFEKRVTEMLETDKHGHDRHGHDRHDRPGHDRHDRHGHDKHGHDSRSSIDIDAVIGATSPSRGRERPKLNVPGSVLEKAGFKPGDRAEIEVLDGEIRIIRIVRIDDHGMKE